MIDPFTVSLALSGINAGLSAYQGYKSAQGEREAREAAARFGAQQRALEESDMMSGLKVPQLGTELAMQSLNQQYATGVESLKAAGAAGVLGGVPDLAGLYSDATLKQAAQLDKLEANRNMIMAENAQNIENRRVTREGNNIADQLLGAQKAAEVAGNAKNQAIASGFDAVTDIGLSYMKNAPLYPKAPGAPIDASANLASGRTVTSQGELTRGAAEVQFDANLQREKDLYNQYLYGYGVNNDLASGLMFSNG